MKEKGLKIVLIFIIILFIIVVIIVSKKDSYDFNIKDDFSNTTELHWNHMPLNYKIYNCTEYETKRIINGFDRIATETNVVSFNKIEDNEKADISIICYEYSKFEDPGYMTAGEAMYWTYIDTNIISKAEIYFYGITSTTYSGGCITYPDTEIHEILHTLGFSHVRGYNYIMNPEHTYCPSKLNQYIINKLKEIYS